eukprot:1372746-Amorphochlora_amoeboformis.AAC.1
MNNAARVYDLAKGTPIGDGARLVGDVVLSHPKAVLVTSGAAIAAGYSHFPFFRLGKFAERGKFVWVGVHG